MIGVCSCCGQSAITTDGLCDECSGFTASKDKQVGGVCINCKESTIINKGLCAKCTERTATPYWVEALKKASIASSASKDKQVGGSHYDLKIQPIDYILQNKLGYCEGNIIKYISRHGSKHGAEDIKKAIHYCEFILANQYGEKG